MIGIDTVRTIAAKYGVEIKDEEADLLMQLAKLPTSDVMKLLNELGIEDTFAPKTERLF